MNERVEKLRKIIPSWKEDENNNPILDPLELSKTMQQWAKEKFGIEMPAPTVKEAKEALIQFAKERGLKQPIFVERDNE